MVATDTTTRPPAAAIAATVAVSLSLDAIEALTDDHVRRHAADPWADLLEALPREQLRSRIERASEALAAAVHMLRDSRVVVDDGHTLGEVLGIDDDYRWDCGDCVALAIGSYDTQAAAAEGLRAHHDAMHRRADEATR